MIKQLKDGTVIIETSGQATAKDIIMALQMIPPDSKMMLEDPNSGQATPFVLADIIPLRPENQTINTGETYWYLSMSTPYNITEKDAVK